MDAATEQTIAWVLSAPPQPCSLCGDILHLVPNVRADEWDWVDEAGGRSARDADLRFLDSWGGPSGRLKWLADGMDLLGRLQKTRKGEKTWPDDEVKSWYWGLAMEYTSLKIRAEGVVSTTHMHQVFTEAPRPGKLTAPLPEHCGWPMRIAPSGWRCRQCTLAADTIEGLELRKVRA